MQTSNTEQNTMKTFRNANFVKRNYECTNVVCCQSENIEQAKIAMPGANWIECSEKEVERMTQLWKVGSATLFGWM